MKHSDVCNATATEQPSAQVPPCPGPDACPSPAPASAPPLPRPRPCPGPVPRETNRHPSAGGRAMPINTVTGADRPRGARPHPHPRARARRLPGLVHGHAPAPLPAAPRRWTAPPMRSSACTPTASALWSTPAPPIWAAMWSSWPKSASAAASRLICTTGVYTEAFGIPYTFRLLETAAIEDIFASASSKTASAAPASSAGLIKIATGDGAVSDYERRMLTAATSVAKRHRRPPHLPHRELQLRPRPRSTS